MAKIKYKADDRIGQMKLSIALQFLPDLPPIPQKDYRLIVLDPPWLFSLREADKTHRGRCSYPSMTDEEILKMPIYDIAHEHAYVLLWVTNNHQHLGFRCLEKWGFIHRSTFTWEKVTKDGRPHIGMGHYGRNCTEHFLVATKGEPGSFSTHGLTNIPNIIRARRRKHSQKPEEFWTIANQLAEKLENCEELGQLSQPSRIELFARQQRSNWDSWGAEANLPKT